MERPQGVYTTDGPVDPTQLGITLIHEHIFFDLSFMFGEPACLEERELAYQRINLANHYWVRTHPANNRDNAILRDAGDALRDLEGVAASGVKTVVDVSMRGEGFPFDPVAIKTIGNQTNLQMVTGTGYYIDPSIPEVVKNLAVDRLAEEMIADLTNGYPDSDFRAGVIGEIGSSYPVTLAEERVMRAAAIAQRKTGAALYLHPGYAKDAVMEVANRIEQYGANTSKVILCHVDSRLRGDHQQYKELAERGFYLGFDTFGREQYIQFIGQQHPSDAQRIQWIYELAQAGLLDKVLISSDICWKSELVEYGGYGRAHITRNVKPRLRQSGFSEDAVRQLLETNPGVVLSRPLLG